MIYKTKNEMSTGPLSSIPPGSSIKFLPHPSGNIDKCTYKAVFNEHRFALYWWNAYKLEMKKNDDKYLADLITIDYHNDLFEPNENDLKELAELNLENDFDVSFFCWARLNGNSDDHILSAANLNLIGNIYALTFIPDDEKEYTYEDKYKNAHNVFVSNDLGEFSEKVKQSNLENVYLDIDLDFFMTNLMEEEESWKLMSDEDFNKYIDYENDLFKSIKSKIDCLTIALEPDYTGSFFNSATNYLRLEKILFNSDGEWL